MPDAFCKTITLEDLRYIRRGLMTDPDCNSKKSVHLLRDKVYYKNAARYIITDFFKLVYCAFNIVAAHCSSILLLIISSAHNASALLRLLDG